MTPSYCGWKPYFIIPSSSQTLFHSCIISADILFAPSYFHMFIILSNYSSVNSSSFIMPSFSFPSWISSRSSYSLSLARCCSCSILNFSSSSCLTISFSILMASEASNSFNLTSSSTNLSSSIFSAPVFNLFRNFKNSEFRCLGFVEFYKTSTMFEEAY